MPHLHHSFYQDLAVSRSPLSQLVADPTCFRIVPENWHVVITDVVNSTEGIERGLHQEINLIATGCIIAVLNIAERAQTIIPFFFGGDGATFLLPPNLLTRCLDALIIHRENSLRNFNLDLRVGSIQVKQVENHTHEFRIAKFQINKYLTVPIFLGSGLQKVEALIKKSGNIDPKPQADVVLDLSGMECKWDMIQPPEAKEEIVALLIDVVDPYAQGSILGEALSHIERIYGPIETRHPISPAKLNLKATLRKINTEMTVKLGRFSLFYLLKNWIYLLVGKMYFGKETTSRKYIEDMALLSDTLVIDGRINTVISGKQSQRITLVNELSNMEQAGQILFGFHPSSASIISCYVRNRVDQHIHFVDGANGGYTQAAKMLKMKRSGR